MHALFKKTKIKEREKKLVIDKLHMLSVLKHTYYT